MATSVWSSNNIYTLDRDKDLDVTVLCIGGFVVIKAGEEGLIQLLSKRSITTSDPRAGYFPPSPTFCKDYKDGTFVQGNSIYGNEYNSDFD